MKKWMSVLAVGMLCAVSLSAFAYTAPTDEQVAAVLVDHTLLAPLLADANPEEMAETMGKLLNGLDASGDEGQNAALLYTRALLLSGEKAPAMVSDLVGKVSVDLVPVLAAATAVAVGGAEGPVFESLSTGMDSAVVSLVQAAAQDPYASLGEDTVAMLQQLVIELRGVAAAVIPPPATAPMNLVPPLVPENQGAPPVPGTYNNQ